jgi:hypothetical protein
MANICASVVITCMYSKHFIYFMSKCSDFFINCTTIMAPMKKRAEKEGGKKKEMITVEVKNGSVL